MLKQLFKKVQKIHISIVIVHYLFDQFTRFLFFKNVFRKLNKILFNFLHSEKKNFVPESKFA